MAFILKYLKTMILLCFKSGLWLSGFVYTFVNGWPLWATPGREAINPALKTIDKRFSPLATFAFLSILAVLAFTEPSQASPSCLRAIENRISKISLQQMITHPSRYRGEDYLLEAIQLEGKEREALEDQLIKMVHRVQPNERLTGAHQKELAFAWPLLIFLKPQMIFEFIDKLPDHVVLAHSVPKIPGFIPPSGRSDMYFTRSFFRALEDLPSDVREQALIKVREKLNQFRTKRDEKKYEMQISPHEMISVGPKILRRNLSSMLFLLLNPEIKNALRSESADEALAAIQDIYERQNLNYFGGYKFADVVTVAKTLQDSFKDDLSAQDSHVIVYGSYPSGLARPTSDIDIHPSAPLLKTWLEKTQALFPKFNFTKGILYTLRARSPWISSTAKQQAENFYQQWRQMEGDIARRTGMEDKPFELVQWEYVTPELQDRVWSTQAMASSSPIFLKIFSDRIEVIVFDIYEGQIQVVATLR